jgi:hypothetical protein
MRAFDQRTGRLERAIDLVQDDQDRTIKTTRAEADKYNPQSRPIRPGPDRVMFKGPGTQEVQSGRYVWMVGGTANSNFERPSTPAIVQGYNFAKYTYVDLAESAGFGANGFGYFGFGGYADTADPEEGTI